MSVNEILGFNYDIENFIQLKNHLLVIHQMIQGDDIKIEELVIKYIPDLNPAIAKTLHLASNKNIRSFEKILDSLGLSVQKREILELFKIIISGHSDLSMLSKRVGVYDEDIEVFRSLFNFIVTTSKFFIKTKPKFDEIRGLSQSSINQHKIQYEQELIRVKEDIEKSLSMMIEKGSINVKYISAKSSIFNSGSNIMDVANDFVNGANINKIEANSINAKLTVREIERFEAEVIKKVITGDQKICVDIINSTVKFLDLNKENCEYIQALCTVATVFLTDVPMDEIKTDPDLLEKFKLASQILGIGEEQLEFLLDLISGSPYRLFKIKTENFNLSDLTERTFENADYSRFEMICTVLGCKRNTLEKLYSLWLKSYKLICSEEIIEKTFEFCRNELKFDPSILIMIFKYVRLLSSQYQQFSFVNFKKSASVFIKNSLSYLKSQVLNDFEVIPFFEKLLSEAKEFRHNDTFADLFDIAEDSTLFDSPFKQISSRCKQDVSDFIDILTNLIEINNSNLNVINKTFKCSKIAAQILYEVFTYARDQNLPSLLTVIDVISSNIKIENVIDLGIVKELFKETIVNPEEWQAANIELLKLSHDEKSKHFSLQLILLFCGFKFWKLFNKNSNDPDIVHNKDIRRFFAEINKFIPKSQNISIDEVKLNKMLPELFCTDFFRDVSKVLLYNVIPQTKVISNPESIIGLIVGLSLGDKKMIRVNLSKLIDKTGNNLLNGIFGIIVNDSSLETDIKAVCKKVKIRSDLTLNLLDLISSDKSKDIYNTCIELCEKYCSSANLVSAIVSLLNGDLSNVRVFADHFKIDNKLVSMLLACASKNINLLTDSLADLSKIIGINSEKAANLMINLYCGKLHSVFELSDKDDNFGIANKQMMFELLSLIKISIQISDNEYQNQLDIPESRVNLKYLLTKLFEVIGYEMNDEDIEITKDKLSKHICNIIDAVWGIGKANDYLKVAFRKYMKNADRKLNKIWYDFPNKTHKIIQSSLKNVYKSAQTSIRNTNIKANKAISDHKKLLAAINSKTPIKFRAGTDKNIISYLDPFQGMCFRVGCLVNIYGSKLADHKFMICRTCSKRTKVDVMVCIPCSEFCHAGHTLVYKVKEYTKGVCFCGAYNIPNIRLNSESNPLYDIDDDRFQLNQSECSLLKDNSSYSKCKKLMYKNKIEKEEFKENENDEQFELKKSRGKRIAEINYETELEHEDDEVDPNLYKEDYMFLSKDKDDIDESADKFSITLNEYNSSSFIEDLILVLNFDMSDIRHSSPKLYKDNLYFYDESLERDVHLFEYFILLAKGYCRPGFIRILSCAKNYEDQLESLYTNSKLFDSIMSLVALIQGDFEYFEKTCKGLLESLGVKESPESSVELKGIKMLYLLEGCTHYTSLDELSKINMVYENMFREIFNDKATEIMFLHKMVTLNRDQLIKFFKFRHQSFAAIDMDIGTKMYHDLNKFISSSLEGDSEKWFAALALVSLKDLSGFDYISKQLGISIENTNIYKSIIWSNGDTISPLFEKLSREIPFDLLILLYKVIKGDTKAIKELILKRIQIETEVVKSNISIHRIVNTPLPKELTNISNKLGGLVESLCGLIGLEEFEDRDLSSILRDAMLQEDVLTVLVGVNAFTNFNKAKMHLLFNCKMIKEEIDNLDLLNSVFDLCQGIVEPDKILNIVENIIISQNLFDGKDISKLISSWRDSNELQVIKALINALNGDLNSIGYIADHLFFENSSSLCSLLCMIASKRSLSITELFKGDKNLSLKLQRDFRRLLEKLFTTCFGDCKILTHLYSFDIDKIIMMLLLESPVNLKMIYNSKYLNFMKSEVFDFFDTLCSENYAPDLTMILDVMAPFINEKYGEGNMLQKSESGYILEIFNIKFSTNSLASKAGEKVNLLIEGINHSVQNT